MSAVVQGLPPALREPANLRRWPAAVGIAFLIEAGLLAALFGWLRQAPLPAPTHVIRISLQVSRPSARTVSPPPPKPAQNPPRPVAEPKPLPRPAVSKPPVPVRHRLVRAPAPAMQTKPVPALAPVARPAPVTPARFTASARARFEAALRSAIQLAVRYPAAADLMQLTGNTVVAFHYRDGRISAVRIAHSSGIRMLDRAATRAVRRAFYPPAPPALKGKRMTFEITVHFRLHHR